MVGDDEKRARNRAAVERAFAAVADGDADRQVEGYTDDVVVEFPYADPPARLEGKEALRARLRAAFETIRLSLTITAVHDLLDPDALVVEFDNDRGDPYIAVFGFRDGLISAQREYYRPSR